MHKPELLAPAGQPDAAYAALHYGADAVYLGLNHFSARAEAENFSPTQLADLVAYAHSLTPKRKIHLTLNTLVQQHELPLAVDTLLAAAEANVDAVIIQDQGIAKIARDLLPALPLHASTQMAVHNPAGVKIAQKLGFTRVVLARELTLPEIRAITDAAEIEIETFIHGTLCYSFSGLCLFSSIVAGRSGNRGRCVYSCREAATTPHGPLHPFSLKDMALGPRILDLAAAGVHSFKIEGRKKSPLYVAATVDYYRQILDGALDPHDVPAAEARLKTIFARPWTTLFLDSRHNPAAADPDVVGHRGAPVGTVEKVTATPAGPGVYLTAALPVERHDGLQIDVPGLARPYGLPVDNLYLADKKRLESVFAAPADARIAVALPEDAPTLSPGLPVYQASSQAVKRSYPYEKPKPGAHTLRLPVDITLSIAPTDADGVARVRTTASAPAPAFMGGDNSTPLAAAGTTNVPVFPARDAEGAVQTIRTAFTRTGDSRFTLRRLAVDNPPRLYIKPGDCNTIRRTLLAALEKEYQTRRAAALDSAATFVPRIPTPATDASPRWIIAVDRWSALDKFTEADFAGVEEIVVSLFPHDNPPAETLRRFSRFAPVRLALPLILREDDADALRQTIARLEADGHTRWLVANLGAIGLFADGGSRDLAADWPLYVMNGEAANQLRTLGISSFTLSPEDDAENYHAMLAQYADVARILVYADLPLFISAACAHAQIGRCRDANSPEHCRHKDVPTTMRLEKTGKIDIQSLACGSVVFGPRPYSLSGRLNELKSMGARHMQVDLRWRNPLPDMAVELWRRARNSAAPGTEANYVRGLL